MSAFLRPTAEQEEAMGLFAAGCSIALEAGAGCGKTSTLDAIARTTKEAGTYTAFNRAIVNDCARSMPMNVTSKTIHSLAMGQIGHAYRHRLDSPRIRSMELARRLGAEGLVVRYGLQTKTLGAAYLASLAMRAVKSFCQSGDLELGPQHVPLIRAIDPPGSDGVVALENNALVAEHVLPIMERAWADLSDPAGTLPYNRDHGYYLKVWQLGDPRVPGEFLMVDEAQDLSGVMLGIVAAQRARGMQVVLVGDPNQQIYEWMGAQDALAKVDVDARSRLTESFRFGPEIAAVANVILSGLSDLRLTGRGREGTVLVAVGPGLAGRGTVLTRTNAASVEVVLREQEAGRKTHLVGGGVEAIMFAKAANRLQHGEPAGHPDLDCFDSWRDVQAYVADDPQGDELALLVKLLDEYGIQQVIDALDGCIGEDAADVIVSTAHKSKGRQWRAVRLAGDFPDLDGPRVGLEERRLLYVACTRAQELLDVSGCQPVRDLLTGR